MALQLVITNAGRAAVIDQANGGFRAVRIAAVGVSPTALAGTSASANLPDEVKRITTIAGEATATDVTHLTVTDETADSYTVRSFALYLSDGTLFALYGQADPIVQKSAQALLLLAIDVALSNLPAAAITFGSANFINPGATTERAGVVELATVAEAKAGNDVGRAITPATAKAAVGDWIGYAPANKAGDTFTGTVKLRATEALRVEGANSYLSFCNEDGTVRRGYLQFYGTTGTFTNDQGGALTLATGGKDVLIAGPGGVAIFGGLSRNGATVWDAANDGAGSGLDADLLDGRQGDEFALRSGADFTGKVTIAGGLGLGVAAPYSPLHVRRADQGEARITVENVASGGRAWQIVAGIHGVSQGDFSIFDASAGVTRLTIDTAGAVRASGGLLWNSANDGAGSGLDADLLDGRQGSEFALLAGSAFTGTVRLRSAEAARLTGANGYMTFYSEDEQVRRGYLQFYGTSGALVNDQGGTLNLQTGGTNVLIVGPAGVAVTGSISISGGLTRAGNTVWDASNDGAGSGLDADLLDGWHRDEIRDWGNLLNKPAAFPVAAHTHGAVDIAGAFPGSLSGNGYTVLPNGLILQWVTGAQQAASSEGTQYVAFPIAFNTCFQVITSTQVANPNIESHAIYQLISFTGEGATVMRQLVSASGADREPSWPRLFAIGR